jgi:hypothetical protein
MGPDKQETLVADIFDEVDEELKQDNAKQLWDRYGRYLVGVAILIVMATAGHVGWKEYVQNRQEAYSEQFMAALSLSGDKKHTEAAAALARLSDDASGGYATLARFREAVERAAAGNKNAAVDIYDAIADDGGVDSLYQGLAVLNAALLRIDDGDPVKLMADLAPYATLESPWRHTAGELIAVLALRSGDLAKAKEGYQKLADDLEAPQGARARATEVLRTLGK